MLGSTGRTEERVAIEKKKFLLPWFSSVPEFSCYRITHTESSRARVELETRLDDNNESITIFNEDMFYVKSNCALLSSLF